jgi:ABC-2 type transport system permease protein
VYEVGSLVSVVVTLYFASGMFGAAVPPAVAAYGSDYFAFALVGFAFLDYMWVSMRSFAGQIRIAQVLGTLEAMLVTPIHPVRLIVYSAAYTYLWTLARTVLYLSLGVLVLGADLGRAHPGSAALFLVLQVLAFAGLGLISAAATLYLKQSDPITSLIGGVSFLLGGIAYPVQSLPEPLQAAAWCMPMTHAVEGLRRALLCGDGPAELWVHAAVLAAWAACSFAVAVLLLRRVLRALSREGSFGGY